MRFWRTAPSAGQRRARKGLLLWIYHNHDIAALAAGAWQVLEFSASGRTEQRVILCRKQDRRADLQL